MAGAAVVQVTEGTKEGLLVCASAGSRDATMAARARRREEVDIALQRKMDGGNGVEDEL